MNILMILPIHAWYVHPNVLLACSKKIIVKPVVPIEIIHQPATANNITMKILIKFVNHVPLNVLIVILMAAFLVEEIDNYLIVYVKFTSSMMESQKTVNRA